MLAQIYKLEEVLVALVARVDRADTVEVVILVEVGRIVNDLSAVQLPQNSELSFVQEIDRADREGTVFAGLVLDQVFGAPSGVPGRVCDRFVVLARRLFEPG